jgi:hypothetical protein
MSTIVVGRKSFDSDAIAAAVKISKSIPQVCKKIDLKYSPTADYLVQKAIADLQLDSSHFNPRRERKERVLGQVHADTREAIEGFLATMRSDSRASYKYILYDLAEALNGKSLYRATPDMLNQVIAALPTESKRKYAASCLRATLTHALKNNIEFRKASYKDLIFWVANI